MMATSPIPHEDSALERIEAHRHELSGTVRRVADYVLANPWETRGISIVELARRAGVSENTVTRFCLKIGYGGYREFATQLASTLGRVFGAAYVAPPGATQAAEAGSFAVVANVFSMEIQTLHETLHRLDREAVERAVEALSTAGQILFLGLGGTGAPASTAAYRLTLLGLNASWLIDPYLFLARVNTLRAGDVAFGISYNGQNRLVAEALGRARARGATAIALTTAPSSPLARNADVQLIVASSVPVLTSQQFVARVAGVLMIDALVAAVAWGGGRARGRRTPWRPGRPPRAPGPGPRPAGRGRSAAPAAGRAGAGTRGRRRSAPSRAAPRGPRGSSAR
jgi:DNA-binding MurR/RpiR family transcriptional regulator